MSGPAQLPSGSARIKCFIIHLASAVERKPLVALLTSQTAFDAEIVDAVDKAVLSEAEVRRVYVPGMLAPRYPFALGMGEVACFLSHRKVWERICAGNGDFALVIEDDVRLDSADFLAQLDWAVTVASPDDLVRFPRLARTDTGRELARNGGISLVLPSPPGLQTCAALVGKRAAARLLAATSEFDRPVDAFIQMTWAHGARVCAIHPPCITEVGRGSGKSLVQAKKNGFVEKVRREFARWRYRRAIARAARP
jgi:GR25 family glycosyltransferase involved in LPS biosynthesis